MRELSPDHNIKLKENLAGRFPNAGFKVEENRGIVVIEASRSSLIELMKHLKEDAGCSFNVLMDLTAVDYLDKRKSEERFEVVYMLFSSTSLHRVRIKVKAGDGDDVPSLVSIWKGANWPEREVFDFFGIKFSGHPLMERLIMPDEFRGYPLRKDFPLEGQGEDYLIESILIPDKTKI